MLQPDVALVGGITGLRRVAYMAQEHNLIFTPHTWTNGMGVVANAHLTAGFGRRAVAGVSLRSARMGPRSARLHDARAAAGGRRGWIVLGDAPGMGYAPDEERLARTRIG